MQPHPSWHRSQVLASNLVLRAELGRVAAIFEERKIPWVVLKGLPLAVRVYGSIADRYSVDNDILVRGADVTRAMAALSDAGYSSAPGRSLEADRVSTFQHPMRRALESGVIARLELHWNAFPPHLYAVAEETLWAHLDSCTLGGVGLTVFDPELTLVHLASHFVQHRCAEPRILEDVARAVTVWQPILDAPKLERLARLTGVHAALALVLRAAWELGMTGVPPVLRDRRADLVFLLLGREALREADDPSYARMALSLALAAPTRWAGALLHELFPHPVVLARIFQTDVPRHPHVLYLRRLVRPLAAVCGNGQAREGTG